MNKLGRFRNWLTGKGWAEQPTKGPYEVLRMTRAGSRGTNTLLVFRKDSATEHLTTYGLSQDWVARWLREKKDGTIV